MSSTITIITGSTLGGAEYVADHVADVLAQQGFEVNLFNQAELGDIEACQQLLVVTSTHGAGELPENIQPLFEEIEQNQPDFSAMQFGVIGLGSSDYDTFCHAVNIVESSLKARGATQICESLKIDVVNNFEHDETAENWLPHFTQ